MSSLLGCEKGCFDGIASQVCDYKDLLCLRSVPRQQLETVPRRHSHAYRRPRATAPAAPAAVEAARDDGGYAGSGGKAAEEGDESRNVGRVRQDQSARANAAAVAADASAVAATTADGA